MNHNLKENKTSRKNLLENRWAALTLDDHIPVYESGDGPHPGIVTRILIKGCICSNNGTPAAFSAIYSISKSVIHQKYERYFHCGIRS